MNETAQTAVEGSVNESVQTAADGSMNEVAQTAADGSMNEAVRTVAENSFGSSPEFWILLALIVAVGIFVFIVKTGAEQRISELKKSSSKKGELDGQIKAIEKKLAALENDTAQIGSALRNYPSRTDSDTINRQLKNEILSMQQGMSETAARIKNIIDALNNTRDELIRLSNRIDAIEQRPVDGAISDVSSDIQTLANRLNQHQNTINQMINGFNFLQSKQNELRSHVNELQEKIQSPIQPTPPKPPQPSMPPTPPTQTTTLPQKPATPPRPTTSPKPTPQTSTTPRGLLDIRDFNIKKSDAIFLPNDRDQVAAQLKIADNLSDITDFLARENYDPKKRAMLVDIINIYKHELNKVIDKFNRGKFDEDILSQECTEAFFKVLSKSFLKQLMNAVYRGRKDNPEFYAGLLARLNAYLAACRVYTIPIEPKKFMKPSDIEHMAIISKNTTNKSEDNLIDEVERLPYNIDYLNEDGEIEHITCDGNMVVCKYIGDAK